jgi:radical SAM protein
MPVRSSGGAVATQEEITSRFARHPALVFWETTRACLLACRHCRASAQPMPLPGELTTAEGRALLAQVAAFGPPRPVVVFTGGDLMMRGDLDALLAEAHALGLVTAVSPSATAHLDRDAMERFHALGVHGLSVSIDAAADAHDRLRGIAGTHARSVRALREALDAHLAAQVNTVVMRSTVEDLADVAYLLLDAGVRTWEVFFLVATGRALAGEYLTPAETLDVAAFLLEATRHGLEVRLVEGPFVRRAAREREAGRLRPGPLYDRLAGRLRALAGAPGGDVRLARAGTLDGDGIVFVAYDGTIQPGGLLPVALGNVRTQSLASVYREHPLLADIRARRFGGACGRCEMRAACGGSRARAYAQGGDALAQDPMCPWGETAGV